MMSEIDVQPEIFKALLEEHSARINQGDSLQRIRGKFWDRFVGLGLPDRQTEVYRYIKWRRLLSRSYPLASETLIDFESVRSSILPECRESVVVFVNGHYSPSLSNLAGLPSKAAVLPLHEATRTYGTFLNNYFAKSIKEEKDAFAALNGALHKNGLFLYLPPKTIVERPLQILNVALSDDQPLLLLPRVNVFVGAQSQLNLISTQRQIGANSSLFMNEAVEIQLEEDAHVHYMEVYDKECPSSWRLNAFRASLKKNSTLKTVVATTGSATVRHDYQVALVGENAEALLNGVCLLDDKREAHVNIFIDHQAPACRSYQLFKSVLNDFSRSSFEGKIMVRQLAQKTEAFQLNNNLLLSDYAHADSKPNLEIFADDVKASHGATVGQLNQDQLFYLRTRGIEEQTAQNLLIYGFCEQVIDLIPIGSIKNNLSSQARHYLKREEE